MFQIIINFISDIVLRLINAVLQYPYLTYIMLDLLQIMLHSNAD